MNPLHSQELVHHYDTKINAHFAEIRILREHRNADCSNTRKLPPEILSMIFGILNDQRPQYRHSKWIELTHVCRTWRNTALNDPSLWIDFVGVRPKWIPEIFARSKAAPLNLRYGHYNDIPHQVSFVFDHVAEHPERIKKLEIHSKGPFLELLNKPVPFLESLSVTTTDVTFPPDFLGGAAPRLTFVKCNGGLPPDASWLANMTSLECGRVHLEAPYLSKLTSLHLCRGWAALDARDGVLERVSIDMFLSVVENMPLLQLLSFVFPRWMEESPSSRSTPVHLPHLRDITADFHDPKTATVFNHLRVDRIERLRTAWAYQPSMDAVTLEPVCSFFERCYHGDDLQYLLQVGPDVEMHRYIGSTTAHTPVLLFADLPPTDLASIVDLVPRCVPRTFVTRLESHRQPVFALAECATIEELRLFPGHRAPSVFPGYTAPPYPCLRRLHLESLSFVPKAKRIPQLKRWIAGRKSATKVELLVLKDCRLSVKDIESLRKVVPVVELLIDP
ncbi:hypothetical protein CCMSSC00406_0004425 [Pleurotus cornucopiae]|uniref:Uncharacterized protein n=1 Tax=Pleurotus cornucopiae TaxID=5321 RepID=A0ACB7J2A4_PLECO|nr:hypothetical protein CCMSSC00406_0004425 [Pleurotus cornucopiae]